MGFAAEHVVPHPPWDSNTDEVVVVVAASGKGTTTIPAYCTHVIISTNGDHAEAVFISPDNTDIDSGLLFNEDAGDVRVGFPVTAGVVISFHNSSGTTEITVNVVRFYNQPSN